MRFALRSPRLSPRPAGCQTYRAIGDRAPEPSKPRQFRKRQLPAVHMHAAEFGAAVQGRKHLAGIEQALGIEGAFQPLLLVEVDLAEHFRHQVALLDADAMLAGEHAAEFNTTTQDIRAESLGPVHL